MEILQNKHSIECSEIFVQLETTICTVALKCFQGGVNVVKTVCNYTYENVSRIFLLQKSGVDVNISLPAFTLRPVAYLISVY